MSVAFDATRRVIGTSSSRAGREPEAVTSAQRARLGVSISGTVSCARALAANKNPRTMINAPVLKLE
jgi:hypothetical protein